MREDRRMSVEFPAVDLNSDVGESFGRWELGDDAAMMTVITSANVACGFHAGDPRTLRRTCTLAAQSGRRRRSPGRLPGSRGIRPPVHRHRPRRPGRRRALPDRRAAGDRAGRRARRAVRQAARRVVQRGRAPRAAGARRWSRRCGTSTPTCPILGLPGSALLRGAEAMGSARCPRRSRTAATPPTGRSSRGRSRRAAGRSGEVAARMLRLVTDGVVRSSTGPTCRCGRKPLCARGFPGAVGMAVAGAARPRGCRGHRAGLRVTLRALPAGDRAVLIETSSAPAHSGSRRRLLAAGWAGGRGRRAGDAHRCWCASRPDVDARRDGQPPVDLDDLVDLGRDSGAVSIDDAAPIEIPVRYDGPDLDEVAALTGLSVPELIAAHTESRWRAAFVGFAPGFAYLTGGDPRLDVPRRAEPRTPCPPDLWHWRANSARSTHGPRRAVGRSSAAPTCHCGMSMPIRRPPSARAGPCASSSIRGRPESRAPASGAPPAAPGSSPGLHDRPPRASGASPGRGADRARGRWRGSVRCRGSRVARAGESARWQSDRCGRHRMHARRADRPSGRGRGCGRDRRAGARRGGRRARRSRGRHRAGRRPDAATAHAAGRAAQLPCRARRHRRTAGAGSRSTDTLSGIGPDPLAAGEVVPIGAAPDPMLRVDPAGAAASASGMHSRSDATDPMVTLRASLGPRDDWFVDSGDLMTGEWVVQPDSNRVGLRLDRADEHPLLRRRRADELPSEGMPLGAVQIPPGGRPVLFLADHPVTGGYPVVAVVQDADVDAAAQLRPGQRLRFVLADAPFRGHSVR